MQLEQQLRDRLEKRDILLMTHIVLGYPSFDTNREVIRQMVENGVDCIEMQIPFSEPMADGPVIVRANQEAIKNGTKVADCLSFAAEMTASHNIPFLFMTYYNIIFKYGEEAFFEKARGCGIKGFIVPDLPPEEGESFLQLAAEYEIAPILIFAPTSTDERMRVLASKAQGFIYCVARRGVTGVKSVIGEEVLEYLGRCRQATSLPLAVGFGIQDRDDVSALIGKADMAVIGSQTIRLVDEKGAGAVGPFIAGLR
ncbi:MAG: tryptophan synthase subunit alpha [Proteobacteria bacterium]|nr:tryptophan synthase subunit alpha [Pseudomonadota bacterium]MBU1649012.1 tryptophan synthase subunit alpha [Pseudomonadota bacterium]MBU1986260.1 tryptophan synthase subunit alpha [Pseudomonadota bacterium]